MNRRAFLKKLSCVSLGVTSLSSWGHCATRPPAQRPNILFIFTDDHAVQSIGSDQGFYLGEHGWYDKRWMYEESFRMPFVARWPAAITPGTRSQALAQNIDFGPTFLEAAGVKAPSEMQGKSLMPLFKNKTPQDWRRSLYYHYYEKGEHNVPRHEGVTTDRYKLIHYYDNEDWELFDLKEDPQEMKSVYSVTAYREIRRRMQAELKRLRKQYGVPENE